MAIGNILCARFGGGPTARIPGTDLAACTRFGSSDTVAGAWLSRTYEMPCESSEQATAAVTMVPDQRENPTSRLPTSRANDRWIQAKKGRR